MKIAIGSDHVGLGLKNYLVECLKRRGHEVDDHGTHSDQRTDYPPIVEQVARTVARGEADRGIVLGGSGQGEQITANKVRGIRAALCHDVYLARMSRAHNDANVLAMGARVVTPTIAETVLTTWLAEPYEAGRHARRIEQIAELEARERGTAPTGPLPGTRPGASQHA
ncbi:ribose 5-phosphate isomerase B [Streptomyces xanthochromogenes]|uniref:ribose 5-phosphate isomerase B n=1 Tax=Streptomyces xanthochromogenes TaxID=67384 RepID=UPI0016720845|nr:ribose 5-phosphate isomerase B [Streptomyces xanthochromogenes]GHB72275.1 ribose 5-phosphate isomerase B [Streptomyces xanthochromogenes]